MFMRRDFSSYRTHYIALIAALVMGSSWLNGAAFADAWSDCKSLEYAAVVKGCTSTGENSKLPNARRAAAYVYLGIAQYERGELEKARSSYTKAIKLDNKSAEAFLNLADLEWRDGKLKPAVDNYTKAIEIDPKRAPALNGRANAYRESGQHGLAIKDYDRAIELDPQSPFAYNGRGNALRDKGEFDNAIKDYDRAIKLDPKYTTALVGRANAFNDKQDWPNAIKDYDAAIAIDPKDAMAYNNRGAAYLGSGDLDRAIADYDSAIALDTTRAAFYFNRALAFHFKGEGDRAFLDRAIADYESTIKRDKDYAYAYRNRGLIYQIKGDFSRAIADYTDAIRINSKDGQSYVARGIANLRKANSRNAIDDLKIGLDLGEKQPAAYIALGDAYSKLGKYDDAREAFDRALTLDPTSSEAYFQRARVFHFQGNAERALKDYDEALALNPLHEAARTARTALSAALSLGTSSGPPVQVVAKAPLNRVALVIGNGDYQKVGRLANPRHDAAAVANAFRQIGFKQVMLVENQTRDGLLKALREFRDAADNAEWATIYYAGHGIEIEGINYIVPVDARLASDRDVQDEAIPLSRFLDSIEHAKQLKLVILDACRDNPFLTTMKVSNPFRSVGRGLARIEPGGSTLVAYAAKNGQVAQDGVGANSPFVKALLERMLTPGLEIRKIFGLIRDDVLAATSRLQEPSIYGTLGGDDYIINPN